jgi:hypothetical protein
MVELIRDFQGLIAAAISITAGVLIIPRVAERFARSRELWTRRMDLAHDLGVYVMSMHSLPNPPANVLAGTGPPEFMEKAKDGAPFVTRCRLLYGGRDRAAEALMTILPLSLTMPHGDRMDLAIGIAKYFEFAAAGATDVQKCRVLQGIMRHGPSLMRGTERFDEYAPPGARLTTGSAHVSMRTVANESMRILRRWSLFRPWWWPRWFRFEREIRGYERSMRRELAGEGKTPEAGLAQGRVPDRRYAP